MLTIRCRSCNKELESHPTQTRCCGCSNMTTIRDDKVSAVDLSNVIMLTDTNKKKKNSSLFSNEDIAWHEQRRKRKMRKLDFEVR